MPNDNGYIIDFKTMQRITKAVREHERGLTKAGMDDQSDDVQYESDSFIEVTGAATTAGYYPALEKWYNIEANTWVYAQDACVAWEMNGGTLDVGKTYKGLLTRAIVESSVVKNVFSVQASGGSGGGSTLVVVKITSALAPITGLLQTYNETSKTWVDGASVTLVEANANNVPVGKRVIVLKSGGVYIIGLDPVAVTSVVCNTGTLTVVGRN